MGDHFVLLVDRLLTESTLESSIESRHFLNHVAPVTINGTATSCSSHYDFEGSPSSPRKVECRICQDEDFDSNMEAPCSCCGSLKYAHRKCVQRWCNEKGDTMCEICHQQFKPGYTAPPPIFRLGGLPMNLSFSSLNQLVVIRGRWQIARSNSNVPHVITMVSTDRSFLDPDYDEYAVSTTRSISCCRSVAMLFMVLLIMRHTLPVIVSRAGNYSFPLIMLLMLRVTGIILPTCIILKAATSILRRRHRHREANLSFSPSDEEGGALALDRPHVIDEQ